MSYLKLEMERVRDVEVYIPEMVTQHSSSHVADLRNRFRLTTWCRTLNRCKALKFSFIYIGVLLIISLEVLPQRATNFEVELGLVQNHQRFLKLFNGVLEAGAGYNQELFRNFYAGASFHTSFLSRKGTSNRSAIYKPGLNLHYYIHLSRNVAVIPQAGINYAILNISNKEYNYRENQSGWNPDAQIRVLWKREKKLDYYAFGRFDYIYLDKDDKFTKLEFYRQVYLTSFGIGLRIKSGTK